jgi:epoxyqueuosine reductase
VEMQDFAGMHSTKRARKIRVLDVDYEGERYEEAIKGLERCPEGGDRCTVCFELRLGRTAELAAQGGYDYFTTTLTISPLKNASRLNRIGEEMGLKYAVSWLPSDFKKKDGYKRSIELSHKFELYRQNYCGCRYSRGIGAQEENNEKAAGAASGGR